MGRSKRFHFRQRAAGWCEAVGKAAEIPPGVVLLNTAVGRNGYARYRVSRYWTA